MTTIAELDPNDDGALRAIWDVAGGAAGRQERRPHLDRAGNAPMQRLDRGPGFRAVELMHEMLDARVAG